MSTILVNNIKDTGNNTLFTSDGSGNISSGGALTNTPAFFAYLNADQDSTSTSYTKIPFNATVIDTDSSFDTSTNYRYTIPSGKGGLYFFSHTILLRCNLNTYQWGNVAFYKNGSQITDSWMDPRSSTGHHFTVPQSIIMSMNAGDYMEIYARGDGTDLDVVGSSTYVTNFIGYRLIGA